MPRKDLLTAITRLTGERWPTEPADDELQVALHHMFNLGQRIWGNRWWAQTQGVEKYNKLNFPLWG